MRTISLGSKSFGNSGTAPFHSWGTKRVPEAPEMTGKPMPRDEGGTRIYLATDRPMSMAELWNQPRYSQYPFTLIELQFDGDGRASGSLMLAARVTADKDGRVIEVENFASEAIPITQIEMQR